MLIALDGHIKLADFASAKQMLGRDGSLPPPRAQLTLAGTPHSIAPEVLEAKPACEDADVWSLGVTLYEMLVDTVPWAGGGTPNEYYQRVLHDAPHCA